MPDRRRSADPADVLVLVGLVLIAGAVAALVGPAQAALVIGLIVLALGIYRGHLTR